MPHLFERYPGLAVVLIAALSLAVAVAANGWYREWSVPAISDQTRTYCLGSALTAGSGRLTAIEDASMGCPSGAIQICGYFLDHESPERFVSDDCPD